MKQIKTSELIGTWRYPEPGEPTGVSYLHFSDDGRMFQFVYDSQKPERRIPLRLWYSVESSSELRVRPKGNPDGWTRDYHFDGVTLTLFQPSRSFICSRVPPDEIPPWFRDDLAKAILRP